MILLSQIEASLVDDTTPVSTALLKMRLLAARLNSAILEDWVRHEIEGYPDDVDLPDYRKVPITFSGTFTNGVRQLNDVPIPSALIMAIAGEDWAYHEFRDGVAVIDEGVRRAREKDGGTYMIDCGNLMPQLTNKVYKGMTCIVAKGIFDSSAFVRVQSTVRSKALDLCLRIERDLPEAAQIHLTTSQHQAPAVESEKVAAIFHQTFNAPVTAISSTGVAATISVSVDHGDTASLRKALTATGLTDVEAIELAEIVASEKPEGPDEPFGAKAKTWLAKKASDGATGIWKLGTEVAKDLLKQYLKQYYFGA